MTREDERCPGCQAELTAECRCGARFHTRFDRLCPTCGKNPRHRRRRSPRLLLFALAVLVAVGAVALLFESTEPRARSPAAAGLAAYERGDFDAAVTELGHHLAAHPTDARSRYLLAVCFRRLGRRLDARKEAERALVDAPDLGEALVFLAERELEDGNAPRAEELLLRAVRQRPVRAEACLSLGRLAFPRGQPGRGAEFISLGLVDRVEPVPIEEMLLLAEFLSTKVEGLDRADEEARAHRLFARVRSTLEDRPSLGADGSRDEWLARAHLGLGDAREALDAALRAVDEAPARARAWPMLLAARAQCMAGRREKAVETAREAILLDSSLPLLRAARAAFTGFGRPDLAREVLKNSVASYPGNDEVLGDWAELRRREGAGEELADEIADLAGDRGNVPGVRALRADVLARAGRFDAAADLLAGATAGDRVIAGARLSGVLREIGERRLPVPASELVRISRMVDRYRIGDPFASDALVLAGRIALLEGSAEEARHLAGDALSLAPRSLEAAALMGLSLAALKDWEAASTALSGVLSRMGARPDCDVVVALARSLDGAGLAGRAVDVLTGFLGVRPEEEEARTLLIAILAASGRESDAAEYVERDDGRLPGLDEVLARGYRALDAGDFAVARGQAIRAGVLTGGNEEMRAVDALETDIARREAGEAGRGLPRIALLDSSSPDEDVFVRGDVLLACGRAMEAEEEYRRHLRSTDTLAAAQRRCLEAVWARGETVPEDRIALTVEAASDPALVEYLRARQERAAGRSDGIAGLLDYVAARPEDTQGRFAAGIALMEADRPGPALEQALAAWSQVPDSSRSRSLVAELLQVEAERIILAGDLAGLLRRWEALPVPMPAPETVKGWPGAMLVGLGDVAGSVFECEDALRRRPGSRAARRVLGLSLLANGRTGDAVTRFRSLAEAPGAGAYDHYLLATALHRAGRSLKAEKEARDAMTLAGHPLFGADLFVSVAQSSESGDSVKREVERLARDSPDDTRIQCLLGRVLGSGGPEMDRACEVLESAANSDPELLWPLWLLVRCELHHYETPELTIGEATVRFDSAGDRGELAYQLAWLQRWWGTAEAAARHATRALELAPGHARAARLLSEIRLLAGDAPGALEAIAQAGPVARRSADTRVLRARILESLDRSDEAEDEYRRALRTSPRYRPAIVGLAESDLDTPGGWREARSQVAAALAREPDDPVLQLLLSRTWLAAGEFARASVLARGAERGLKREESARERIGSPSEHLWRRLQRPQREALERQIAEAREVKEQVQRQLDVSRQVRRQGEER